MIFITMLGAATATIHAATPSLAIESAVRVTFDGSTNRLYQIEAASRLAPDVWTPVGPSHFGRNAIINETISTTPSANKFFRAREYDLTNALVAYFPLNNSAVDVWGMNKISVDSFTEDRFGVSKASAIVSEMSGLQKYVRATAQGFAQLTNDFSISLWIRGHLYAGPPDRIVVSSNRLALIRGVTGALELFVGNGAAPIAISQPALWENTRWYCFHVVRANNEFSVYRDAELVVKGVSPTSFGPPYSWNLNFGPRFGAVDDVRLYNRALSHDEVAALSRVAEK